MSRPFLVLRGASDRVDGSDRSGDVSLVRVDLICFYESGWLSPAGDVRAPDGTGAYTKNHKRKCYGSQPPDPDLRSGG